MEYSASRKKVVAKKIFCGKMCGVDDVIRSHGSLILIYTLKDSPLLIPKRVNTKSYFAGSLGHNFLKPLVISIAVFKAAFYLSVKPSFIDM